MFRFIFFVAFLLQIFSFSVLSSGSNSQQEDWVVITVKDGVTIYSKKSKGSAIRSLRAVSLVDAPIAKITSILRDVDGAKDWVPNLVERSYIEDISDTEAILYDITDMPWPVSDRDMVVHHKLSISKDKKSLELNFKSIKDSDKEVPSGIVRAVFHLGKLSFRPEGDKTHIEMIILVDPMGSVPTWAVNVVQVSMPYDFIMSLNKFAKDYKKETPKGITELINSLEK